MERVDITKLENRAKILEIAEGVRKRLGILEEVYWVLFMVNRKTSKVSFVDIEFELLDLDDKLYRKMKRETQRAFSEYSLYVGDDWMEYEDDVVDWVKVYSDPEKRTKIGGVNFECGCIEIRKQEEDGSWEIEQY